MTWRVAWVAALIGAATLVACKGERPTTIPPAPKESRAPPPCERIVAITVTKRARQLRAFCEGGRVVALNVALGRGSAGPKRREGDARTPEGYYEISGPPRASRFHVFIPLDYPSISDAELARTDGRVSEVDYQRIIDAHVHDDQPPGDTALGGQIGLHGEGKRWRGDSRHEDWTLGCVGLADADVDFLATRSAIGTPVLIEP